jgi:hypothetical protein
MVFFLKVNGFGISAYGVINLPAKTNPPEGLVQCRLARWVCYIFALPLWIVPVIDSKFKYPVTLEGKGVVFCLALFRGYYPICTKT